MFNTNIPLYGIFIVLSIIGGLTVICMNIKTLKFRKEENYGLLIYIALGAIFGAKYFNYLSHYDKYGGVFEFSKIGLSSYGAVIGIIVMVFLFSKMFKKKFWDIIYIHLPAIPFMYAIGKFGCFLAGCCHGIEYDGLFNVVYNYSYSAPKGVNLFPIQLLETFVFFIIFVFIYISVIRKKNKYKVTGLTLFVCGISKFLLDYLRISHVGIFISLNQIVSIVFMLFGVVVFFYEKIKLMLVKGRNF